MYRSLKSGTFSDISNRTWAKNAALAQAKVAYELAKRPLKLPSKTEVSKNNFVTGAFFRGGWVTVLGRVLIKSRMVPPFAAARQNRVFVKDGYLTTANCLASRISARSRSASRAKRMSVRKYAAALSLSPTASAALAAP